MIPNLLRQVVSVEWLLLIGLGFLVVNVGGIIALTKVMKRLLNAFDVHFAEHEILMYAKAMSDGCSRQYLRDTAVAAAAELARRPSIKGKAKSKMNGAG